MPSPWVVGVMPISFVTMVNPAMFFAEVDTVWRWTGRSWISVFFAMCKTCLHNEYSNDLLKIEILMRLRNLVENFNKTMQCLNMSSKQNLFVYVFSINYYFIMTHIHFILEIVFTKTISMTIRNFEIYI